MDEKSQETSTDPLRNLDVQTGATFEEIRARAQSADEMIAAIANPKRRTLSPISKREVPDAEDLAWAAGLFDGEGCVHIARHTYGKNTTRRPTYRLRVTVCQSRLAVLREFEWAVGLNGTYAHPKPTKKQNRVCHALNYDGLAAYAVLERLTSKLRRKLQQARLAKEFRKDCAIHEHPGPQGQPESVWELRRWYYERMRMLNLEG